MNMKKLILGALLVVGATSAYAAGGNFVETGVITADSKAVSGNAALELESTGTVMDVTQHMVYLQLKPKANAEGDTDTLNFNFGKIVKGTRPELSAKYEARLFLGMAQGGIEQLKPVQFKDDTNISLGLVDNKGTDVPHDAGTPAKFVMEAVNEQNDIIGKLEYEVGGSSGLTESNYAYVGDVFARLYTHGSTTPTGPGYDDIIIDQDATGTFTAKGGKFTFTMAGVEVAGPAVDEAFPPTF